MKIKDYYAEGECPECHCEIPDDAKAGEQCKCGHTFVNTFKKISIGYVIQEYTTMPDGTHVCTGQEFVAGEVQYESSLYGDDIDTIDTLKESYCPMDMVQPDPIPTAETKIPEEFERWFKDTKDSPEDLKNLKHHYQDVLDQNAGYPLDFETWAVKYYKYSILCLRR